jgi:hypothetical protein
MNKTAVYEALFTHKIDIEEAQRRLTRIMVTEQSAKRKITLRHGPHQSRVIRGEEARRLESMILASANLFN